MSQPTTVNWISLGRMDYDEALAIQMSQRDALLAMEGGAQTVFTVEHPPTITIGRNGSAANIVASEAELQRQGFTIREVDRGGDVTYHGPGQLVVYPVLHLSPFGNDVSLFVRRLEEMVIQALAEEGMTATRLEAYPGVWLGDKKICAVGARVKRRANGEFVTSHGIALNVATNLAHFQTIIPCGIQDKGVTSVAEELQQEASVEIWEEKLRRHFEQQFSARTETVDWSRERESRA
ncbi:lipoyl(octanoyl) transferase LipB [Alicyclobacillus sp. TC]|uniref:lipoyl(octanoyl) transferase LipB n=1 Tax=Alicyclobacillus sp. TC TaxID=2606450 RepID=UPI001932BA5F|nr:lipoyl(octanoyl) transferase LipB [Alicyclobacillus sp. TC]QRF23277.1 lipoyl(octanoyl) transferase LipB [Alicyclobacillus sp. TC]